MKKKFSVEQFAWGCDSPDPLLFLER